MTRRPGPAVSSAILAIPLLVSLAGAPPAVAHEGKPGLRDTDTTPSPKLSVIGPAPDFTLVDTDGRPVHLAGLRGHVVLLSFIYTHCTAACPLLTARMAVLQERLRRAGGGRLKVRFLTITVDPARDTAPVLAAYARRLNARPATWRFLREDPERLGPVLAAYDEWTRISDGGEVDHPARLYLVDPVGRLREIYSLAYFNERQAFLDIQALLREAR